MACRMREAGSVSILDIEGRLDINASEIVEAVGGLITNGRIRILCNLENVEQADYGGLSVLAIAYKNVVNHKGAMKFVNVPLHVMELLKVVHLDCVFDCYYDEPSALAGFFSDSDVSRRPLRRKFPRIDTHLKVTYQLISNRAEPVIFSGNGVNLSGAGLYVATKHTFPLLSPLSVTIRIPGRKKPLVVPASVVWLPDSELQPHAYPGMGVAFSHLTSKDEAAIVDYVEKNISTRLE